MRKEHLRPIGTKFTTVSPPANTTSMNYGVSVGGSMPKGDHFIVAHYIVEKHVSIDSDGEEWAEGPILEKELEFVQPLGWQMYCDMIVAIPPPELLELLPQHWRMPTPYITYDTSN
jgi:hypothetical protein